MTAEIQTAYKEDTVGRHYHTPIVTKRSPIRMEKPSPPVIFSLNKPIGRDDFKKLSDETKVMYIKHLKEKYNATAGQIAEMLGYNRGYFSKGFITPLGINDLFPKGGKVSKKQIAGWKMFLKSKESTESEPAAEFTTSSEVKPAETTAENTFCDCSFTLKGKLKVLEIAKKINAMVEDGVECLISIAIKSLDNIENNEIKGEYQ